VINSIEQKYTARAHVIFIAKLEQEIVRLFENTTLIQTLFVLPTDVYFIC